MDIKSQKGITLVELMVALGILSMVSAIGFTYYNTTRNNLREVQFAQVMRTIAKDLEQLAQNPSAIAFSARRGSAGNLNLANCIERNPIQSTIELQRQIARDPDAPTTVCDSVDPNRQVPFDLYVPPKDPDNFQAERRRVSGGGNTPEVWYDVNGKRGCLRSNPKCVIRARTYFWANCPRRANEIRTEIQAQGDFLVPLDNTCLRAQSVNIRYQVSHVPSDSENDGGKKQFRRTMPSIPRDEGFWQVGNPGVDRHNPNHSYAIDVAQLGRYADEIGECKENETLIEVRDSQPICRCLPPFRALGGLAGACTLDNHQCGPDERYIGVCFRATCNAPNGQEVVNQGDPLCQPVNCQTRTVQGFEFTCGANGWLSEIRSNPSRDPVTGQTYNCTCEITDQRPLREIQGFRETCHMVCSFNITCCTER